MGGELHLPDEFHLFDTSGTESGTDAIFFDRVPFYIMSFYVS